MILLCVVWWVSLARGICVMGRDAMVVWVELVVHSMRMSSIRQVIRLRRRGTIRVVGYRRRIRMTDVIIVESILHGRFRLQIELPVRSVVIVVLPAG